MESTLIDDVKQLELSHEMITKQLFALQKELEILRVKETRYDALQDRYNTCNEKHFDELCGTYFSDYPLKIEEGRT